MKNRYSFAFDKIKFIKSRLPIYLSVAICASILSVIICITNNIGIAKTILVICGFASVCIGCFFYAYISHINTELIVDIQDDDTLKLWYRKDNNTDEPKKYCVFYIVSDITEIKTEHNKVKIFGDIMEHEIFLDRISGLRVNSLSTYSYFKGFDKYVAILNFMKNQIK